MAPDVIQLIQSYDHPSSSQTNWTSLSSMVMSLLQTVLLALFFARSLPSMMHVTLIIFMKNCPPGLLLLFISMHADENMGSSPIQHASNWTSPSSMVVVLIVNALFFARSLLSTVTVTLMIFMKKSPPGLLSLFISMGVDENMGLSPILCATNLASPSSMVMSIQGVLINWCSQLLYSRCCTILHTTVYFLGQNRASDDDDDDSGAINGSRCHTCRQYLTDKTFCLERMMLAYMFWLVRHLSFRTAIGTAIDVQVGTMGGLSSYITTWLLNPGGFLFIAQRNCIGLLL